MPSTLLDWIPVEELQVLVKYGIADFAALSIFKGLTFYGGFLFPQDHDIIKNIDMTGLFLLLGAVLILAIIKIVKISAKGVWHGKSGIIFA